MIGELIDIAVLEDFVAGLARASGLRVAVYGLKRELLAASAPGVSGAVAGPMPPTLPRRLELVKLLPAREPPAGVAFVEHAGLWTIVVPVHVGRTVAGFVGVGLFRNPPPDAGAVGLADRTPAEMVPVLRRRGDARPVAVARWASRILADWCLNEARLQRGAEQLSLLADIGQLLSGAEELPTVLERIVVETARVMNLPYCSLRLYNPQTGQLTFAAGYNVRDTGPERTMLRSENPIDDLALSGQLVYIEDATRDPRVRFAAEARRLGIVSGLAAGMIYRGEPIGVLRVYAGHRKRFRVQHRNLLRAVASHAAIAVVNARLLEQRLRAVATERELVTAGQVQARMIRTPPPAHPQVESALLFEPSSHVGGDLADIFLLPDGRLAAAVGDVAGHGVPAALLMASARGALRASVRCFPDLADVVGQLNNHICRETTTSEFMTLLLVAVDAPAGRVHYVSAGHEPLLRLRQDQILRAEEGDAILGLEPDRAFTEHTLDLRAGDFLLLYTDGVIEAINFAGQTFGRERLHAALRQFGTLPPDQALGNIRWDVRRFVGLAEQSDDLAMVGLRLRH